MARSRTWYALAAGVCAAVLVAAPAQARQSAPEQGHVGGSGVFVSCQGTTELGGDYFVYATVLEGALHTGGYNEGRPSVETTGSAFYANGAGTYESSFEVSPVGSYEQGRLNVTWDVMDDSGGVGSLGLSASLQPSGPWEMSVERDIAFRRVDPALTLDTVEGGNHHYVYMGAQRPMMLVEPALLTLPTGEPVEMTGCLAQEVRLGGTAGKELPVLTSRYTAFAFDCVGTDGESEYRLGRGFSRWTDGSHTYNVQVFRDGELIGFTPEVAVEQSVTLGVHLPLGLFEPVGQLDLSFGSAEPVDYAWQSGTWRAGFQGSYWRGSGTVRLDGGPTVELSSCTLAELEVNVVSNPATAAPTKVGAPANDGPAGALAVVAGTQTLTRTDGTVPVPEITDGCMRWATNTVWFTVPADTALVVDTAGTRFDTILAAYRADPSGDLVPVAGSCVDDVAQHPMGSTLQAKTELPAVPGETYYLQVGGTANDANLGLLRLRVDGLGL
jgi:hypothetical protein